jgi:hypothetical protein
MHLYKERYKCDRNGGQHGRYLSRADWRCPSCGELRWWAGHRCQDCRRRVCCQCFHHDLAACLTCGGSDVEPTIPVIETCGQAIQRKGLAR